MTRQQFLRRLFGFVVTPFALPVWARAEASHAMEDIQKLEKPRSEWRAQLSREAYAVLFEEDTERSHSSPLNQEKRRGTYICAACYLALFESATKYESGTGWPSFYAPIEGRLETKRGLSAHLAPHGVPLHPVRGASGHVFNDGPPPTRKRWCNNGLALNFVPAGEPLPALRT